MCVFVAPCATGRLPNCNKCSDSCYDYSYLTDCSCNPNCLSNGDCCSDISATTENCFGKV